MMVDVIWQATCSQESCSQRGCTSEAQAGCCAPPALAASICNPKDVSLWICDFNSATFRSIKLSCCSFASTELMILGIALAQMSATVSLGGPGSSCDGDPVSSSGRSKSVAFPSSSWEFDSCSIVGVEQPGVSESVACICAGSSVQPGLSGVDGG